MATKSVENESSQSNQTGDTDSSEVSQSPSGESTTVTVTSINELVLTCPENIGNWCDLLENDDTFMLNNGTEAETKQSTKQPADPIPFQHEVSIVLGKDLLLCQLPNSGPYNALVYELSDNVTEPELYMLFGGPRAIDSYIYRSELREMLLQFREHQHLVDAMLRQGMQFKEKPLLMAVVLIDHQIDEFHRHNAMHRDVDMYCIPLDGAYDKCHERQADGSMMELFGDTASIDTESISSASQIGQYKRISDDVRLSQNYFQYPSNPQPNPLSRTESITSMGSMRSSASRTQRQISKDQYDQKSQMFHHPPPQTPGRQGGSQSTAGSSPVSNASPPKQKSNPFGDAKPVDTNRKVLQVHERVLAQKQSEHQKTVPPVPPNFSQPPPNYRPHEINPNVVKIQRRPEGVPPAGGSANGKVWMNSNIQIPPPPNYRQQQQQHSRPAPNHVNVMDETIDVSKPPPPLPQRHEKQENRKQRQGGSYKNSGHGNQGQQYNKNGFGGHGQQQNYQSHQSLPPSGPNSRRKSSTDQPQSISDTLQAEKSQSAPLTQEGTPNQQSARRDSPSNQSLKRPNSANSSMSFVTALSGSEISSTKSTELTCVPGSMDSIPERLSDATEERRHSWEGQKSPAKKKETPRKKSGFNKREKKGSASGEIVRKSSHASDGLSRQSSTSPPQYQSASNVFLEASEGSTSTVKSQPLPKLEKPKSHEAESKPVSRTKNSHQEKRAPSLPLSRPHTASNDKDSAYVKMEPSKADSLSAPPTPIGPNKKRKEKAKAKANSQLHNNKFRTLADCHDIE